MNPAHLALGDQLDAQLTGGSHSAAGLNGGRPRRRLSAGEVARMRAMWLAGDMTQKTIAKVFSCGQSTVSQACSGTTWASLP